MSVIIRKFEVGDIPNKVRWINDPQNNKYLHYTLPLTEEGTGQWWEKAKDLKNRLDMTILDGQRPVGIIGLLGVDTINKQAELYITIGEQSCKGKGIAGRAMEELCRLAFDELGLQRIFLYTETQNTAAVRAYQKFGMTCRDILHGNIMNRDGEWVDRYIFDISKEEFEEKYGKLENDTNI